MFVVLIRRCLVVLAVVACLATVGADAGIVDNSTTSPSGEDSLAFIFHSLDSLGNPTTADSVYLLVTSPSGEIVVCDSMAIDDGRVSSATVAGQAFYRFADQVSNLDGSGAAGSYSLSLLASQTSTGLVTPTYHDFQIAGVELSDRLAQIDDSIWVRGGAVDSNRTELGFGADSSDIAGWVWNTPQSGHDLTGTFGGHLDARVSSVTVGEGAFAVIIQVYDTTVSAVVSGCEVAVRNLSQTALLAQRRTDVYGRAQFNLDAESLLVIASAPGYIFEAVDTLVVDGTLCDTLRCGQFTPGAPLVQSFCRVWGFLFDAGGMPDDDVTVTAHLPSGITFYDGTLISPVAVSTTTDSTGYFYVDLIPSDSLGDGGVKYEFAINRRDGTVLRRRLVVPDSTSWRLTW